MSIERRYLAELLSVSRDTLDAPSRLTYDIFRRRRELKIEAFTFPNELLPINPFGGMTQQVAAQARELARNPAANAADYAAWLKRIDDYVRWTQQAAANMREGIRRGYTSPRSVIERMLPILERLGMDDSAMCSMRRCDRCREDIKDPERARLTQDLTRATAEKLLPASRVLHDFLQKEYLPRARTGLALSELPLGREWYAFLVRNATSSALWPTKSIALALPNSSALGRCHRPRRRHLRRRHPQRHPLTRLDWSTPTRSSMA